MNKTYTKTIQVDLDGVLNTYNGGFSENFIPPIKDGAKEFLEELSKEGEIVIFTTRNRLLASKWLIENGIDHLVKDITNVKNPAFVLIDDRCICFKGDFKNTLNEVKSFRAYWK